VGAGAGGQIAVVQVQRRVDGENVGVGEVGGSRSEDGGVADGGAGLRRRRNGSPDPHPDPP